MTVGEFAMSVRLQQSTPLPSPSIINAAFNFYWLSSFII